MIAIACTRSVNPSVRPETARATLSSAQDRKHACRRSATPVLAAVATAYNAADRLEHGCPSLGMRDRSLASSAGGLLWVAA